MTSVVVLSSFHLLLSESESLRWTFFKVIENIMDFLFIDLLPLTYCRRPIMDHGLWCMLGACHGPIQPVCGPHQQTLS